MFDDFVNECEGASNWPINLLGTSLHSSILAAIHQELQLRSPRLFISDIREARVDSMEALTGETQYTYYTWVNNHELTSHYRMHFEGKEKDPLVRYIFLNAAHSRAQLNCTLAMFTYMCTYHHILPEFTDLVYTFGQSNIDDFSHARFIRGDEEYEGIPELSRSDRQSRIAYKLFAMERSDFDDKWTMRQFVVYHSLDLTNGRMFWLMLKTNGVIKDRIREDHADRRRHPTEIPEAAGEALEAALKTHMILLNWSCEGWRWYITQLEQLSKSELVKVIAAPIPSNATILDPVPDLVRALPMPISETTSSSRSPRPSTQRSSWKIGSRKDPERSGMPAGLVPLSFSVGTGNGTGVSSVARDTPSPANVAVDMEERQAQIEVTKKRLNIFQDFSLEGVQYLTSNLSKVNQAKTAMTMNIRMAEDLRSYYEDICNSRQLDTTTFDVCANEHRRFQWKVKSLQRLLEMECLRADGLAEKIRDHIHLYEMILESEAREVTKLFAMNADEAAKRVESATVRMEAAMDLERTRGRHK